MNVSEMPRTTLRMPPEVFAWLERRRARLRARSINETIVIMLTEIMQAEKETAPCE